MPRYKLLNGIKVQLTAEEEAEVNQREQEWLEGAFDRSIANLRAKRDELLNETDWIVTKAKETGTTIPTAWKTYRQALRDITENLTTVEEVNAVVFPDKP